jgi:hypothetical protein
MVDVLFMLLIIGFGTTAFGKRFRLYSIGTILVVVVFGALAGMDAPRIEANLPTPWVGVTERINIDVSLLRVVVLAIALLRIWGGEGVIVEPMRRLSPGRHVALRRQHRPCRARSMADAKPSRRGAMSRTTRWTVMPSISCNAGR